MGSLVSKVKESGICGCIKSCQPDSEPIPVAIRANNSIATVDHGGVQEKHGTRFRALYDYNPGYPKALDFKAGDVIVIVGQEDRFTLIGYNEGKPEEQGTLPATYVNKIPDNVESPFKSWNPQAVPTKSCLATGTRPKRKIRIDVSEVGEFETYAKAEYDRCGEFDPMRAQAEWNSEEAEEAKRQMEVRWEYLESKLPPGQKCEERILSEQNEAEERLRKDMERAERRRKFLEARAAKRRKEYEEQQQDEQAEFEEPTPRERLPTGMIASPESSNLARNMSMGSNASFLQIDTSIDEVEA